MPPCRRAFLEFSPHGHENHSDALHRKNHNAGEVIRLIVKEKITCPQDRDSRPSIKEIFVPALLALVLACGTGRPISDAIDNL